MPKFKVMVGDAGYEFEEEGNFLEDDEFIIIRNNTQSVRYVKRNVMRIVEYK